MDPTAARAPDRPSNAPRAFLVVGILLIAYALSTFASGGGAGVFRSTPFDLTINMVAAQRLVDREPLYDADASREQAVERSGPDLADAYTVPTNGFPGLPSTALVHAPFLLGSDATGYAAFRWASLLSMLAAIALAARALPGGARLAGAAFGTGVLLTSAALVQSVDLGQGHGFVMLGFGVAIWGVATGRWRAVGIGLGVATALKLSPALIVAYLALRVGRRARRDLLVSAGATVGLLALLAAAVGRPADLWVWATDVAPSLSGGALQTLNQSVPAVAARLVSASADLGGTQDIGAWRHLALPLLLLAAWALFRLRRGRQVDPLEVGVLLLAGLVVGPLTWSHYATWAALPLVLLADPARWSGRSRVEAGVLGTAVGAAVLLLMATIETPTAAAVRADPALRLTTAPTALALVLLLAAASRLVTSTRARRTGPGAAEAVEEPAGEPAPLDAAMA